MSYQPVGIGASANDGTGDPARTAFTKVNANFSELYAQIPVPTILVNQTGSVQQSITSNTWIDKIVVTPQIGTPSIMIGTTSGGSDLLANTLVGSSLVQMIQSLYLSGVNLYFTITSGNINIRIDNIPNYI